MIIRFKTSILMSSLCDYCDAYILAKRTIKKKAAQVQANNAANKNI